MMLLGDLCKKKKEQISANSTNDGADSFISGFSFQFFGLIQNIWSLL